MNPAIARALFGSFSPRTLGPQLLAWWDAGAVDTLNTSSAGDVSSWTDLIGGYVASNTLTARPTYSATGLNGRPALSFDPASSQFLEMASNPFPVGANPCEIWALVDQQALAADTLARDVFSYGTGASSITSRRLTRVVTTGVNRARIISGTGASSFSAEDALSDFSGVHVLRATISGTGASIAVDGGTAASNTGTPNSSGAVTRIGAASHLNAAHWNGKIAAVLVTAALTEQQAAQLTGYLKRRAAI